MKDVVFEKLLEEASQQNIFFICKVFNEFGKKTNKNLYTLSCGHTKEIRADHVRTGSFTCTKCRATREEYLKKYRLANKNKTKESNSLYYAENKDKLKIKFSEYYISNKDEIREKRKLHYEENKSLYLSYSKYRKFLIKRNAPTWLSKDQKKQITDFYKIAKEKSLAEQIKYHVDHIVPLNGESVCGLHVPWNLQILTEEENLKKSNKHQI